MGSTISAVKVTEPGANGGRIGSAAVAWCEPIGYPDTAAGALAQSSCAGPSVDSRASTAWARPFACILSGEEKLFDASFLSSFPSISSTKNLHNCRCSWRGSRWSMSCRRCRTPGRTRPGRGSPSSAGAAARCRCGPWPRPRGVQMLLEVV